MTFPWSKKQSLVTQAYRLQLDSVVRELRMTVSDVPDDSSRFQLIAELDQLESTYRNELRVVRHFESGSDANRS